MKKLIVILMALIAYSTQALADKVSFTASAPDVVVVRIRCFDGAEPFSTK